jgi:predicted DCC family thiol-disulfide oxidoreductase YuxK
MLVPTCSRTGTVHAPQARGSTRESAAGDGAAARPTHIEAMSTLSIWFDGACPLCRREIAMMRRLDRAKAIRFIDVAADGAACPVNRTDLLARFHALEDGRMLSGAAAFAAMWRAIPLLRPLGLAARNPHVLAMLEWLYGRFLRVRPRLQRLLRQLESGPAP